MRCVERGAECGVGQEGCPAAASPCLHFSPPWSGCHYWGLLFTSCAQLPVVTFRPADRVGQPHSLHHTSHASPHSHYYTRQLSWNFLTRLLGFILMNKENQYHVAPQQQFLIDSTPSNWKNQKVPGMSFLVIFQLITIWRFALFSHFHTVRSRINFDKVVTICIALCNRYLWIQATCCSLYAICYPHSYWSSVSSDCPAALSLSTHLTLSNQTSKKLLSNMPVYECNTVVRHFQPSVLLRRF